MKPELLPGLRPVRLHFGFRRKGPRMKREPDRATGPKERKISCTTSGLGTVRVGSSGSMR